MKQKFGTRLTSLLLCLALVAGLLQGLPVTAKAADSHGSDIDMGTTWYTDKQDVINLGDRLAFCYKPFGEHWSYAMSRNEDTTVPEPEAFQDGSENFWVYKKLHSAGWFG